MAAAIESSGGRADRVGFRLAAGIAISLALHAVLLVNVSSSAHSESHPASTATPPRLTIMLAGTHSHANHAVRIVHELPSLERAEATSHFVRRAHAAAGRNDPSATRESAVLQLPLPEPRFLALSELDTPPTVLQDIDTDPPELVQYAQGGRLVMQLWIDETGRAVRAAVLDSDLPAPFAASAETNFMRAVFSPGKKDGVPVRTRLSIEIVYRPR